MATDLGYLDTNLFVHALYPQDAQHARCQAILAALDDGTASGILDPLVIHELGYVLLNLRLFPDRAGVARYLQAIVRLPGAQLDDRDLLLAALVRWSARGDGFVDAWLATLALMRARPVCTVNAREFPDVPNSF